MWGFPKIRGTFKGIHKGSFKWIYNCSYKGLWVWELPKIRGYLILGYIRVPYFRKLPCLAAVPEAEINQQEYTGFRVYGL